MKFESLCLFFVILSEISLLKHVVAKHEPHDLSAIENEFITNLFIKNLEEDYKTFSNERLTPEIATEISGRYKAFRESRRRTSNRHKRNTNDDKGNIFYWFLYKIYNLNSYTRGNVYQKPKRYSLM